MSEGTGHPLEEAIPIAEDFVKRLGFAKRVEIAGSIRRRRRIVSDIEIVLEPSEILVDMFGAEKKPDVELVQHCCRTWGQPSKCGGKFIQVPDALGTGFTVDVFLVTPPAQFGSILAIRTGPAGLSQHCVTMMRGKGYRHVAGHVETQGGELMPTPSEGHFFSFAGVEFVEPWERDDLWAKISVERRNGDAST